MIYYYGKYMQWGFCLKKIVNLILCTLLLFTINSSFAYAISDSTPPVIEKLKILTPVVKPGGKVKIQVRVSDDVSGTKHVSFSKQK